MAIKVHLEQLKQQDLHLSGELPEPVLDLQLGGKDALHERETESPEWTNFWKEFQVRTRVAGDRVDGSASVSS